MWEISSMAGLILLIYVSYKDIRIRAVPAYLLIAAGAGSIIYHIVNREMNFWLLSGGMAIGGLFLLISKITEEGMGYGDSIGIMILGLYLGLWRTITVLSIAFFLLLCVLIPFLWKKRMSKKTTLPFYPFLTAGYFCLLCIERAG